MLQTILIEKRNCKITPDTKTITAEMDFTFMYCVVQNLQMYTRDTDYIKETSVTLAREGTQLFMVSIIYVLSV